MRLKLFLIWLCGALFLWDASFLLATATWSKWNSVTVGSSSGNISKYNNITIGTTSGNMNAWNALAAPSSGGGTAYSYVQVTNHNNATATTCTIAITTVTNDFVVTGDEMAVGASVTDGADGSHVNGLPSDTVNTYTAIRGPDRSTSGNLTDYSAAMRAASSASITITWTHSVTEEANCWAIGFTGVPSGWAVHTGSYANYSTTPGTAMDSGAFTPTAGDLMIGYGGDAAGDNFTCATTGLTPQLTIPTGGQTGANGSFTCVGYILSAAGGSVHALMTASGSAHWSMSGVNITP